MPQRAQHSMVWADALLDGCMELGQAYWIVPMETLIY